MRILARFWHLGSVGIEVANGKHGGYCHRQQLIIISLRIYFITGTGEVDTGQWWGTNISDIGFNPEPPHVPSSVILSSRIVRNHNRISLR